MKKAEPLPWKEYFEHTKGKPPRPMLINALTFVKNKDEALDFGAGAFNDVIYLLSQGFKYIIARDKMAIASEIAETLPAERLGDVISIFEEFDFPKQKFELVNAPYALPFIRKDAFSRVFKDMSESMKKGAILTGQFFGDRDGWKDDKDMTFHSRAEVEGLLKNFNVIELQEEERDKVTAAGDMKHWHIFHFIASK